MKYSITFKNGNIWTFESDTDIDIDQVFASAFRIDKDGELTAHYIKPLKITKTDGSIVMVNTNEILTIEKCAEVVGHWKEHYYPHFDVPGIECSICGAVVESWASYMPKPDTCPNCHSKMEVEK